jgi:hypothetical protein
MIEIGDIVSVNKDDACINLIVRAEVLNVPRAEGDAWGFRDLDNPREVWTTERITITKRTQP